MRLLVALCVLCSLASVEAVDAVEAWDPLCSTHSHYSQANAVFCMWNGQVVAIPWQGGREMPICCCPDNLNAYPNSNAKRLIDNRQRSCGPSVTPSPTKFPTINPTKHPTSSPTKYPTKYPTSRPTKYPTPSPTNHICGTNQHNCDASEGGVCYTPGALDYAGAKTDHDMGVNGKDDHTLDSNEWFIPAHSEVMAYNTDGDTTHLYKCGCKEGYNCVAGCSPPFNGHRCEMTKYPTPYPSSSPTPYPTPTPTTYPTPVPTPSPTPKCPVTCEKDIGQFQGRSVPGIKVFGHHNGRLVSTHDSVAINLEDTYTQHRCYHDKSASGHCVCECLDAPNFEIERHADWVAKHQPPRGQDRGRIPGQDIFEKDQSRYSGIDQNGLLLIRKTYKANTIDQSIWPGAPRRPYRVGDHVIGDEMSNILNAEN